MSNNASFIMSLVFCGARVVCFYSCGCDSGDVLLRPSPTRASKPKEEEEVQQGRRGRTKESGAGETAFQCRHTKCVCAERPSLSSVTTGRKRARKSPHKHLV